MPTGKGPLRIAIEDFLTGFGFGNKVRDWIKDRLEEYEGESLDVYQDLLIHLQISDNIPEPIQPATLRGFIKHQVQFLLILLPIIFTIVQDAMHTLVQPFTRPLTYLAEGLAHTKHPEAPTLLQMMLRRPDLKQKLQSMLPGSGYDDVSLEGYRALIAQYLSPAEYQAIVRRGQQSQAEVDDKLRALGYSDEDITAIHEVTKVIPPVSDLIRMQVREAFRDDVAARYGYDEGQIDQVTEWAAKVGLDPEWVKRYWRAHWELPSVGQVFEMLHRLRPGVSDNPVTQEEVDQFLGLADFAPGWRKRLTEISYAPFTRVDVRRMYKTHVLDESQVKEAYLDLGYNDEKAQALTEFTIAYEAEEETGVVRSSVTSAYQDGMIDRATATEMLSKGGYDATTIDFYLNSIDFKQGLDVKNIKLQNIKKRFIEGMIDESQVNAEIGLLALPSERTEALLELWTTERENQTQLLTITQMETLLERGIVTEEDYKRIATLRGYSEESITWTLTRIAQEAADKARTEAEKAQADSERLLKSKTSSQYQKDKSVYDLAIAQARAEITDIDVALHSATDPADVAALGARKDELKIQIAGLNVGKAQLRSDTQTTLNSLGG